MASGYHFWLPLGPAMLRRDLFQRSETSWWPPAKGLFCDNIPVNLGNYRMKIYETSWISMDDDGVGMGRSSRFLPLEIPILWSDSTGCSTASDRWPGETWWLQLRNSGSGQHRYGGAGRPAKEICQDLVEVRGSKVDLRSILRDFEGIDLDFLPGFIGCCYCCYTLTKLFLQVWFRSKFSRNFQHHPGYYRLVIAMVSAGIGSSVRPGSYRGSWDIWTTLRVQSSTPPV